ncbi:MAG TPA: hypothetical protein VJ617_12525 [Arthrobacter sp.]|nr:hypothetical protein [Arthrobacter sp.]
MTVFLGGDRYSPDSLIAGLESRPGSIAGVHLYSFNSLDSVPGGPDPAPVPSAALIPGAAPPPTGPSSGW